MVLLAIARYIRNSSTEYRREPPIAEILSDSMLKALMEADGIDPEVVRNTATEHGPRNFRGSAWHSNPFTECKDRIQ
jgi:hypothetical protein